MTIFLPWKTHWQDVYCKKGDKELTWFQESPLPHLN
jgi:hypothetical protein